MIITCVHQGFELYGSDRSFIETIRAFRMACPQAQIDVVLPRHGPLTSALEPYATAIVIEPLWVLRRKNLLHLATLGLSRLPGAIWRAHRRIGRSDIVYINTSVVADYMIASRFTSRPTIIHVHEIATGMTRRVLRHLVRFSGARIVFNSAATRDAFGLPASQDSRVIYNGLAGPAGIEPKTYVAPKTGMEPETSAAGRPLRLLMLGRYSRIKGQEVLIRAISQLPPHLRPLTRIAGGAFEDHSREEALAGLIDELGLRDNVQLLPFMNDPAPLYRWADIVAVPSRLPESLGRVAIEAMAYGRPPLVSRIGGLPEVVLDGSTGWLVPPDDAGALARQLRRIIEDPQGWDGFPAAGRARFERLFSEDAFHAAIDALLGALTDETAAAPAWARRPVAESAS